MFHANNNNNNKIVDIINQNKRCEENVSFKHVSVDNDILIRNSSYTSKCHPRIKIPLKKTPAIILMFVIIFCANCNKENMQIIYTTHATIHYNINKCSA